MSKIKFLGINKFRGLVSQELQLDGKSLVIYGENGTGKSSFVDSIEYLLSGQLSSISRVQALNPAVKYISHKEYHPDDTKVIVEFENGDSVERTHKNKPSFPEWLKTIDASNIILRRNQILGFVNADPGMKYRFISDILGLSEMNEIELSLKHAKDEYYNQISDSKYRIKRILNAVKEKDIGFQSDCAADLEEFISRKLVKDGYIDRVIENFSRATVEKILSDKIYEEDQKFLSNISKIESFTGKSISKDIIKLTTIEKTHQRLLDKYDMRDTPVDLLRKAREHLEKTEKDTCPVCEQSISIPHVIGSIDTKLETVMRLTKEADEITNYLDKLSGKFKTYNKDLLFFRNKLFFKPFEQEYYEFDLKSKIDEITRFLGSIDVISEKFIQLLNYHKKITIVPEYTEIVHIFEDLINAYSELKNLLSSLVNRKQMKKMRSLRSKFKIYISLLDKLDELREDEDTLRTNTIRHIVAENLFYDFKNTRNQEVSKIFNSMQDTIKEYYHRLHPYDSGIGDISLDIDPDRRSSMILRIEMFGDSSDPRGYCSEGHLDSLGIVIFLAFMKIYHDDAPFLILDDVVTAIDSGHRKYIADLLFTNFSDKQSIITTHDTQWFNDLKSYVEAYNHPFITRRIKMWDPKMGLRFHEDKPTWEKIHEYIANDDLGPAANSMRTLCENKLTRLAMDTRVMVPYNYSGDFRLGIHWEFIKNHLMEIILEDTKKDEVKEWFQNIKAKDTYLNILSHDSLEISKIKQTELRNFANDLETFLDNFVCSHCKSPLKWKGKIIKCNIKCPSPTIWKTI